MAANVSVVDAIADYFALDSLLKYYVLGFIGDVFLDNDRIIF